MEHGEEIQMPDQVTIYVLFSGCNHIISYDCVCIDFHDCYLLDLSVSWLDLLLTLSIISQTAEGSGLTLNDIFNRFLI